MSTHPQPATDPIVIDLIARARSAQKHIAGYSQQQIDTVVTGLAWAVVNPGNNQALATLAVAESGMGNVADKVAKNHRKTLGLLHNLQGQASVGTLRNDPLTGITEIARPVGIVAALTPATHPVAVAINNIMNAVKGRNAIIISPSPKGVQSCAQLLQYIYRELDGLGVPRDIVQMLPAPIQRPLTQQLMREADLVIVTGSQNNVEAALGSGTPALGVGTGNVAVIISSTADIEAAARNIATSKCFDNATSCSSENSLVILDERYSQMLTQLTTRGGVLLTVQEKQQLQQALWPKDGKLSRALAGRSAPELARAAGLTRQVCQQARFLLVEEEGTGKQYPFSGEKLSPVLTLYRTADFAAALHLVERIYAWQGAGHSTGLYSLEEQEIRQAAETLPAARIIVNQAHCIAAGGSFTNGLPFSLSLGCGTWGGNLFTDNLNFRHFINTVRIVRRISPREPSPEDLFTDYLRGKAQ